MQLVSIHKQILVLFFLLAGVAAQGQVWSFSQCIDTAIVHNKNLQMVRNNMSISEQRQKEAKANLIPKVSINADYKYFTNLPHQLMPLSTFNPAAPEGQFKEAQFGVPHNLGANLQVAMPIYNPQVYGAISGTKIAAELTDLQYQKSEEEVYFQVANLYYNAQILHHQLTFIDSNHTNAQRLLQNMQLLQGQLLAKGTDVSKVELQVEQLTTQKLSIKGKYNQVLNSLKFAMGVSLETELLVDPSIAHGSLADYSTRHTLDLQIAKKKNQLLANELSSLNKSRYLPSVNLFGSYGTTGFGYDKEPSSFLNFYTVGFAGVQLTYPLFNGTVTQRKVKQKQLEIKNNELQVSIISEQNTIGVENAQMQRSIAFQSMQTTEHQINLAQSIYSQTILQQRHGTASLTEVLLADNALREAQQNYLSAVIDFMKAELELKKLSGNISTKN